MRSMPNYKMPPLSQAYLPKVADVLLRRFPVPSANLLLKLCLPALIAIGFAARQTSAEEPYRKFLDKLRQEQLFDLALVYVNDLEKKPGVSREFKASVELERGLLSYQSAAMMAPSASTRPAKLNEAEAHLRQFLETQKNHPRRGEARLKLGELLLTRAEEERTKAGETDEDVPEAIKFYNDAHELFESTIQELAALLERFKGNRIAPGDKAKIAIREQIQKDLRQAQLLSAKAVEERGRSRATGGAARKKDMEQALKMFSHLYTTERRMVGIRNYALFYRSNLYRDLGKPDDAIDGYQRVADTENIDILRPLQTSATTELTQLLSKQQKYPLAVDRAEKWVSNLRPDEESASDTLTLKLALARARIEWAAKLAKEDREDRVAGRQKREARTELQQMLRTPGSHLEETRELLAELGIDSSSRKPEELPKVKNFQEALAAATERLSRINTETINRESLSQRLSDPSIVDDEKSQLKTQLAETQTLIDIDQRQAIELLRSGLRLFGPEDDRDQLFEARYRLALLHLEQQQPWDAIVIAEFLSFKTPGTEKGLNAGAVALAGFSDLLRSASTEQQQSLSDMLEPLATHLANTWPESKEASAATAAMVQLALVARDWSKAETLLQRLPTESASASGLRRSVGMAFYSKYLEEKSTDDQVAISELREKTATQLNAYIQQIAGGSVDSPAIEAINAAARLALDSGDPARAAKMLLEDATAPVKALRKKPSTATLLVALDSYRLAILVASQQMSTGKLSAEKAATRMQEYVDAMQKAAAKDPKGGERLASVFVGLARDMQEQFAQTKKANERKRLAEVLIVVASQAAKLETFNVQFWAANMMLSVAEEIGSDQASRKQAVDAYSAAQRILDAIVAKETQSPGWIEPATMNLQIQLLLARSQRGSGDYAASIGTLAAMLRESPMLLDGQIEAAKTLEAWAKLKPQYHKTAYQGGPGRSKLFWGWGRIAQETLGKEKYNEQFFQARYRLAYNRYKFGVSTKDQVEIGRAEKDISRTSSLYPDLGGPAWKKKFDALQSVIKKSLGK